MIFRHGAPQMPGLNTSSLPDLIFTVLFFFMTVTHMRKAAIKVKYREPQSTELTKLAKRSATTYIYIGKSQDNGQVEVQVNDKITPIADIASYVTEERNNMAPEDVPNMGVSLKADRNTPMGVITDVKQQLRKANVLRINYSATKPKSTK